jgi:chemotaxis protein MotA
MGTIIGFGLSFFFVIGGIYISLGYTFTGMTLFFDPPSIFITCGCTVGVIFICHPLGEVLSIMKYYKKVFNYPLDDPVELVKKLVKYSELARKNGILALDGATEPGDDPFMAKGIQLAVDIGKYAPAFGMVGTLIGLVIMLKNLSDPAMIGPNMAVALITTFYGALMAFMIFGPVGDKLGMFDEAEKGNKDIIITGVLAIQSGDNPRMVEQKLKVYLAPADREKVNAAT